MKLKIGVVVHDASMERFGVVIDAAPLEDPSWVLVRWEPLAAALPPEELETSAFAPMPRFRVVS